MIQNTRLFAENRIYIENKRKTIKLILLANFRRGSVDLSKLMF